MMKYKCAMSEDIENMIALKAATNFSEETYSCRAKEINDFCAERFPNETVITESLSMAWANDALEKQVMIDSDLAMLYQVETKNLNKAASRNVDRFPEDFRFKLTKEEFDGLRFQSGTSNQEQVGRGGRRYYPYAYTEQGISMLASVLHSKSAVQASINIMRTFVEMRRFIANNALLFEKVSDIELKQLEYQKNTDERFDKVFQYIEDHAESEQKIFFDGQIYDASSLITSIIQKAQSELILTISE